MTDESSSNAISITVSLRQFLALTICPPRWKAYNLYLFRDDQVTFYVGQSYCAFDRVWEHLKGGPKGHSTVGRFILVNWPRSGDFTIELMRSPSERLDDAEQALIEELHPCFNVALNGQPTVLPAGYLPMNAPIKYLKNLRRMMREAGYRPRPDPNDMEWK